MNSKNLPYNVLPNFSPNFNPGNSFFSPIHLEILNSSILLPLISKCAICLRKLKHPVKLIPCFHFFCFKCIKNWQAYNNSCPICRQTIRDIFIYKYN